MLRKLIAALAVMSIISSAAFAAIDLRFPYANATLRLPPASDPFPGLGTYYTALSQGMSSALWNPASLGRLKLSEVSLGWATSAGLTEVNKETKVNELSGTMEVGGGGTADIKSPINYAVFFRYPADLIGVGTTTREITINTNAKYVTNSSGLNFSAAQKVNDWLVVGFGSYNPVAADFDIAGDFPLTGRMAMSLYGKSFGDMQFTNDGKLRYTFNSDGTVSTLETTQPVWSGYLSQEATIPFTSLTELRNNLRVESPYMATLASKYQNVYFGLNIIPMSASGQIENDVRAVCSSTTNDQLIYVPNFDPNDQTQAGNWLADPDKYATEAGYSRKTIDLPNGEIVGDAKYRGYYAGSASRMDFGMQYDVGEWLTLGLALENFGGAVMNLKGDGQAAYVNYRDVSTAEIDTLLQPGSNSTWTIFKNAWITTTEVNGTPLFLESEKTFAMPKRTRMGAVIKKPILIALDYEQNQTGFVVPGTNEASNINVSNLNFLRLGVETQVFALPWWLRLGTTLAFKPTITGGVSTEAIDRAFQFGVLPTRLDLGTEANFWSYKVAGSFGINAMPAINLMQFDMMNADLAKMVYYSLTLNKEAWTVNYLCQVDVMSTAATYGDKPVDAQGNRNFEANDLKYLQTLGVTYRF